MFVLNVDGDRDFKGKLRRHYLGLFAVIVMLAIMGINTALSEYTVDRFLGGSILAVTLTFYTGYTGSGP